MGLHVNDNGTWKLANEVWVNDSGTWKPSQAWINDSGSWKIASGVWDVGNATDDGITYDLSSGYGAEGSSRRGPVFSPDGKHMYITTYYYESPRLPKIRQADLSTVWDITTASPAYTFDLSGQMTYAAAPCFSAVGDKMYVPELSSSVVYEYSLSTPRRVSTASYTGNSLDLGLPYLKKLTISPDGIHMFGAAEEWDQSNPNRIVYFDLSTPWDLSTAGSIAHQDVGAHIAYLAGVDFSPDGKKMFLFDEINNTTAGVHQFSLNTPWDVSSLNHDKAFYVYDSGSFVPAGGGTISWDGTKLYLIGGEPGWDSYCHLKQWSL